MKIRIVNAGYNYYKLSPISKIIGRQYDNNATRLVFTRPDAEIENTMSVNILVGSTTYQIILGTDNEVLMSGIFFESGEDIKIGVMFSNSEATYRKNSEVKEFEVLEALEPSGLEPTDITDQWLQLYNEAVVDGYIDDVDDVNYLILEQNDGTKIYIRLTSLAQVSDDAVINTSTETDIASLG